MDAIVVGNDVSKDKLDIAVLPQGQTFATSTAGLPLAQPAFPKLQV
jgi:hypothetical protein